MCTCTMAVFYHCVGSSYTPLPFKMWITWQLFTSILDSIQGASEAGNICRAMISDWIFLFTSFLGENKIDTKILNIYYNYRQIWRNQESMHVWSLYCMVVQGSEAKDKVIEAPLITVLLHLYAKQFTSFISNAVSYTNTFNPSEWKAMIMARQMCMLASNGKLFPL